MRAVSQQHPQQRGEQSFGPHSKSWQLMSVHCMNLLLHSVSGSSFSRMLADLFSWHRHIRKVLVGQTIAPITGAGLETTTDVQYPTSSENTSAGLSGWPGGVTKTLIPDDVCPWAPYLPQAMVAEVVDLTLKLVKGMPRDAKQMTWGTRFLCTPTCTAAPPPLTGQGQFLLPRW